MLWLLGATEPKQCLTSEHNRIDIPSYTSAPQATVLMTAKESHCSGIFNGIRSNFFDMKGTFPWEPVYRYGHGHFPALAWSYRCRLALFGCVCLFKGLQKEKKIPGVIAMAVGGRMQRSINSSRNVTFRTLQGLEGLLSANSFQAFFFINEWK